MTVAEYLMEPPPAVRGKYGVDAPSTKYLENGQVTVEVETNYGTRSVKGTITVKGNVSGVEFYKTSTQTKALPGIPARYSYNEKAVLALQDAWKDTGKKLLNELGWKRRSSDDLGPCEHCGETVHRPHNTYKHKNGHIFCSDKRKNQAHPKSLYKQIEVADKFK